MIEPWHGEQEDRKKKTRNGSKTTQKSSREDNEQLKYDLTVIVSSKLIFNLRQWVTGFAKCHFAKYQLDKYLKVVLKKFQSPRSAQSARSAVSSLHGLHFVLTAIQDSI